MTYSERALQYCRDVLSGQVLACKWIKAACQRHLDDLDRIPDNDWAYCFDAAAADRVCAFIELLPHIKGEWARKREALKLEDWQCFYVCSLFGWLRKADGLRRFRISYLEVARKNAKSTLLAAIGLYLLAADGEAGAEVYSLATTRDQAKAVWAVAHSMTKKEPEFRAYYGVHAAAHAIMVPDHDGTFQALSSEANTLDGLNVHGGLIDELHAHPTRAVWDVIETATGARSQPLVAAITTAGTNRAGICYEQRSYTCSILTAVLHRHDGLGYRVEGSGIEDETYFGLIYTLDDEDDWTDERVWIKPNPNLGVSVAVDDMRRLARKAMQLASAAPNFLTKRCNVWVNADAAWMDMRAWDRAADRSMRPEDFQGWDCFMGIDLASKRDITALATLFRRDDQYRLFLKLFLPEERVMDSANSQYRGWADSGHLIETDGNVIDETVFEAELKAQCEQFQPVKIGFDPGHGWNFCARMSNEGLPMEEIRATKLNLSEPMKELERLTLGGGLRHDGNPAMAWMISNVVCHRSQDFIEPRKEHEENKIDGPVAAMIAVGQALKNANLGASIFSLLNS